MINLVRRSTSTPTAPRAAAPVARPIVEETVTLAGTALSTAAIGGLCAALAPVGGAGFHFAAQAVVGAVIAGVGGGAVGAWLVSMAADYGTKLGHFSHSQDEKIINPVMGFVTGGIGPRLSRRGECVRRANPGRGPGVRWRGAGRGRIDGGSLAPPQVVGSR